MADETVMLASVQVAAVTTTGLQLPVSTPPALNVLTLRRVSGLDPTATALNCTFARSVSLAPTVGPAVAPVEKQDKKAAPTLGLGSISPLGGGGEQLQLRPVLLRKV